jgi:DNA-binding CsgD family transcriptional regulator
VSTERAALSLVGDAYGMLEIEEFRVGLLSTLREAVPSDWVSLNEVGPDPASTFAIVEPALEERWFPVWKAHALENPLVAYFARTHDGRPFRFSDIVSREEYHALALYRDFYEQIGLEHQIAFTLPARSGLILGVALSRRERDYSDDERELLELARPHLIQAYNNALRHSELLRERDAKARPADAALEHLRSLGLTAREAEVLGAACAGRADREIGQLLQISHRTVQKHLERCYSKLGVNGRAEATSMISTEVPSPQSATT